MYSSDQKFAQKNDFLILVNFNWRLNLRLNLENKKTGVQLTRVKNGENVLKISKCLDSELLISHLDISASSFLTNFLEKLEDFSSQQLFHKALDYVAEVNQAFHLVVNL